MRVSIRSWTTLVGVCRPWLRMCMTSIVTFKRSVDFQEVIRLFSNFQSLASCNPNRGDTTLFWTDKLTCQNQNQASKDLYPQLYSFSKKQKCSLQFYVEQEASRLFSLPLSQLANQLVQLEDQILESNYDENQNDHWSYC